MPVTCKIDPERIYDDGAVVLSLDIPSSTLMKARREGSLRYTWKGRRVLYLGQWLLDWLSSDATRKGAGNAS
jgi:hypothetical protein